MEAFPRLISNLRCLGLAASCAWCVEQQPRCGTERTTAEPSTQLAEVIVTRSTARRNCRTRRSRSPRSPRTYRAAGRHQALDILTSGRAWRSVSSRRLRRIGSRLHSRLRPGDFDPAFEPGVVCTLTSLLPAPDRCESRPDGRRARGVLRGPQGTLEVELRGGAIRFVTRKPTVTQWLPDATYGTRNRLEARAGADFKLTITCSPGWPARLPTRTAIRRLQLRLRFPASGVPASAGGTSASSIRR